MKHTPTLLLSVAASCGLALSGYAQTILVDDTFADGSRTEQNLPTESAWFANNVANISASPGNLALAGPSGSAMYITYFTPATAQSLNVGDSMRVTVNFSVTGSANTNTSRGVRLGVYDFSGGTRVAADGFSTGSGTGAPGAGVYGYMLNMNFGTVFGIDNPLQLMARTSIADVQLMGTTGDYTSLGSGGGMTGDPGFEDSTPYTLVLLLTRTGASAIDFGATFSGGSVNSSFTVNDSTFGHFGFDTFAFRPAASSSGASMYNVTRFTAEYLPVPEPSTFALAGMGLLGLIFAYRRSRR